MPADTPLSEQLRALAEEFERDMLPCTMAELHDRAALLTAAAEEIERQALMLEVLHSALHGKDDGQDALDAINRRLSSKVSALEAKLAGLEADKAHWRTVATDCLNRIEAYDPPLGKHLRTLAARSAPGGRASK